MKDPVYVGIGISSHEADTSETSVVSNVELTVTPRTHIRSKVNIYDLSTKKTEVIFSADKVWEAPNWSPDGKFLMVNSGGDLYRLAPEANSTPQKIEVSEKISANNDHGITNDGKLIAISGRGQGTGSQIFIANMDGTKAHLVSSGVPSYFHGFSPDSKYFAYAAERAGNFDLYRMELEGGVEQRLTGHSAYDDGPDYSPDGKWIYYNSERSGHMQIWRIPAEGAGEADLAAERVITSDTSDWFPHPSPNAKEMVIISFPKGTRGHPPNRNVELRLMPMPAAKLKSVKPVTIVELFGGQGTINVNSWSPDSKRFAFVSYERVPD
jgi:Tol biopolymer transport system component